MEQTPSVYRSSSSSFSKVLNTKVGKFRYKKKQQPSYREICKFRRKSERNIVHGNCSSTDTKSFLNFRYQKTKCDAAYIDICTRVRSTYNVNRKILNSRRTRRIIPKPKKLGYMGTSVKSRSKVVRVAIEEKQRGSFSSVENSIHHPGRSKASCVNRNRDHSLERQLECD